jgi:protein TonB
MGKRSLMTAMKYNQMMLQGGLNLTTRGIVVALVLAAHVGVYSMLTMRSDVSLTMHNEMSVNFAIAAPSHSPATLQSHAALVAPTQVAEAIAEQAVTAVEQTTVVARLSQAAVVATPVVADTQPDYKAAYLNNPPPSYPLIARRNGLQGRVVLNVEVLANGSSGQVTIQSGSGYAMLDNAALQTVKIWRFIPGRHGGQAVDKWFMIPIQFSLKDNQI